MQTHHDSFINRMSANVRGNVRGMSEEITRNVLKNL